jgi:hypothetical protein
MRQRFLAGGRPSAGACAQSSTRCERISASEARYADGDDEDEAVVDIGAFELAADEYFGGL